MISVLKNLIHQSHSIVALTGAGISTAAGIPDFRGPQGLYITQRYDPDTVFDLDFFLENPKPFYDFARDFLNLNEQINPTVAHRFLSQLEREAKLKMVITQNIDTLHQKAGSNNVIELHGSFMKSYCLSCLKTFQLDQMKLKIKKEDVPHCSCGGVIKPDVVFFGENVKRLEEAFNWAKQADLLLVIGTSCVVFPAAMIPEYTHCPIVVINLNPVQLRSVQVDYTLNQDIETVFTSLK